MSGVSDKALLETIRGYIDREGIPPSIRELCHLTGLKSSSSMAYRLDRLEAQGKIKRHPRLARGISVVSQEANDDLN